MQLDFAREEETLNRRMEFAVSTRPDIAVYDRDHKLQLIVEVKSKDAAPASWAARMRRNLLAHSMIPNTRFFMLATPDSFYLWRDADAQGEVLPHFQIDATQLLAPYADRQQLPAGGISECGLELLVASWLTDVMNSALSEETVTADLRWLLDSGLYEAIKNGSVASEATV
jgi:hypothetical protein